MSDRLVAITGATGFLGRHLAADLQANGWRVRILARKPVGAVTWLGDAPKHVVGDLEDTAALTRLVSGADAVVHAAGLIKARTRREFFAVNEEGARRVAIAAEGRRLVHISSLAAREPDLSDYAASKRAGERAVREVAGDSAVIVRPPAIYGPGDWETLALFKMARRPVAIVPGRAGARLAIAEVNDVAGVVADLLDMPMVVGTVAIGGDRPEGYSWAQVMTMAAHAIRARSVPIIFQAPTWLVTTAGTISEITGRWRSSPPIFTRGKAREALHSDWSVSEAEQGMTAGRVYKPLADGFERTVAWYRANGWLP